MLNAGMPLATPSFMWGLSFLAVQDAFAQKKFVGRIQQQSPAIRPRHSGKRIGHTATIMIAESARLCFIGNLLRENPGYPASQSQFLAKLLVSEGYDVTSASSKLSRLARLADIVSVLIIGRRRFDAVVLDLYSNFYFLAADIASLLCKLFRIR